MYKKGEVWTVGAVRVTHVISARIENEASAMYQTTGERKSNWAAAASHRRRDAALYNNHASRQVHEGR